MFEPGVRAVDAERWLAARLAASGIDDPRTDARRLVEAATGLRREHLLLAPERALTAAETDRLCAFTIRRLAREPVTRIEGERSFYGRTFSVSSDTLDPRPDTETLVDLALELVSELMALQVANASPPRPLTILDIGTGTGCILLTLLAETAGLATPPVGCGIDISAPALAVARANAAHLGLEDRVEWKLSGNFEREISGDFDIVVSNPPYIPTAEIAELEPEVRLHDPTIALDGGSDGLAIVRRIVAWSASRRQNSPNQFAELGGKNWFALEVGAGQSVSVLDLIADCCGKETASAARLRRDLGGHTRCVAWQPHF